MQRDICHLYIPVLLCSAPRDCGAGLFSFQVPILSKIPSEHKSEVPDNMFDFIK